MDLSIFTVSQQEDALRVAIDKLHEAQAEAKATGENSVRRRVDLIGMDVRLMAEFFSDNEGAVADDGEVCDGRTLCEGLILGVLFALELVD